MKIIGIIQARMGSTRLPGKVFLDLSGKPLIWHVFNRLEKSKFISKSILATTTNSADNLLVKWAISNNIEYFRGDESNVLKRYYESALKFKADIIVRITADDPLKDYKLLDSVINLLLTYKLDVATNNNPPTYPEGLDVEVFTMESLTTAYLNAESLFEKEHVSQYFYLNKDKFKINNFENDSNLSDIRLTIDTEEDYEMVKLIYNKLYIEGESFDLNQVLQLLKNNPVIKNINQNVIRSQMYKKI